MCFWCLREVKPKTGGIEAGRDVEVSQKIVFRYLSIVP